MAPLRSSRSTRNQDHHAASRSRGIELDPTDGLPVQKWQQLAVKINQDPSSDPNTIASGTTGATTTSSAEWAAQFGSPQYPWSEKPLPSFFSQIATWNQEMIRQARCGNTNPTISQYDPRTQSYVSAAELEKRKNAPKMGSAETGPANNEASNPQDDLADHDSGSENDEQADEDMDNADGEDAGQSRNAVSKKRKALAMDDRTFDVKRWVQIPLAVAEKQEERKFLADRRPGMPSLYGGPYQNQVFAPLGLTANGYNNYGATSTAYDLGDGAGLSTAMGGVAQPTATPARRNMPPKRKKKKGGPGRRKVNPPRAPADRTEAITNADGAMTTADKVEVAAEPDANHDTRDDHNEDEGSDDSDGEGEGSEEGEVDEQLAADSGPQLAAAAMTETMKPVADLTSATTMENAKEFTKTQEERAHGPAPLEPPVDLNLGPIDSAPEHNAISSSLPGQTMPQSYTQPQDLGSERGQAAESPVIRQWPPADRKTIAPPPSVPLPHDPILAEAVCHPTQSVSDAALASKPISQPMPTEVKPEDQLSASFNAFQHGPKPEPEPEHEHKHAEPETEHHAAPLADVLNSPLEEPSSITPAMPEQGHSPEQEQVQDQESGPGAAGTMTGTEHDEVHDKDTNALPETVRKPASAAAATASVEPDLLGGLEESLDRDMRE